MIKVVSKYDNNLKRQVTRIYDDIGNEIDQIIDIKFEDGVDTVPMLYITRRYIDFEFEGSFDRIEEEKYG